MKKQKIYYEMPITLDKRQLEYFTKDSSWICKNPKCVNRKGEPTVLGKVNINKPSSFIPPNDPQSILESGGAVLGLPIISVFTGLKARANFIEFICEKDIKGTPCKTKNILSIRLFSKEV